MNLNQTTEHSIPFLHWEIRDCLDTSTLEEVSLPKVDKVAEQLKKKKHLLAKRKKLLELKRRRATEKKMKEQDALLLY